MPNSPPPPEAGWYLEVDPGSAGLRLDQFLSLRIQRLSRSRAAKLQVIDLDSTWRPLKKSTVLQAGQRLWARRPVPDAQARPPAPRVLYEDDELLVLDKPAGLATHPTASRFVATVSYWLKREGRAHAEPAHRLDVETSGLLLCGKGPEAIRLLKRAFAQQHIEKAYLAVVEGRPPEPRFSVRIPLGPDLLSAVRLKMGAGHLSAHTDFELRRAGAQRALLEARPVTGRQHQIRCHLALSGLPIVGDKLYGPDEQLFLKNLERPLNPQEVALLGSPRQALHAWQLRLLWREAWRTFESPLPADLEALLDPAE